MCFHDRPFLRLLGTVFIFASPLTLSAQNEDISDALDLPPPPAHLVEFPWTNTRGMDTEAVAALPPADLGPFAEGAQIEANPENNHRSPEAWDTSRPFAGILGPGRDTDSVSFVIPEDATPIFRYLSLTFPADVFVGITLTPAETRQPLIRNNMQSGVLGPLLLEPGEYQLTLTTTTSGTNFPYRLGWLKERPADPTILPLPFANLPHAQPVQPGVTHGRFPVHEGSMHAHFYFEAPEPDIDWYIQIDSPDPLRRLIYLTSAGATIATTSRGLPFILEELRLGPGKHPFRIISEGSDSPFTITVRPQTEVYAERGTVVPGGNLLPNPINHRSRSQVLRDGDRWVGRHSNVEERSWFRYFNPSAYPEIYRLTLEAPPDQTMRANTRAGNFDIPAGTRVVEEFASFPGYKFLEVFPREEGQDFYQIGWDRLNPLLPRPFVPPFDSFQTSYPLPKNGHVYGSFSAYQQHGYFALPEEWSGEPLYITSFTDTNVDIFILDADTRRSVHRMTLDTAGEAQEIPVADDATRLVLQVRSSPFDLVIAPEPVSVRPAEPEPLPLSIELIPETPTVTAYWPYGQVIPVTLRITSEASEGVSFPWQARPAYWGVDLRWRETPPETIRLEPGESREWIGELHLPADLRDDLPILIDVVAGGTGHTLSLSADPLEPPRRSFRYSDVPEPFRGTLNVAAARFGARPLEDRRYNNAILDEMRPIQRRSSVNVGDAIDIELAGTGVHTLIGVSLDPFGTENRTQRLADFSIATSTDGETFEEIFQGRLNPISRDQFFAFPEPVPARFVRVTPLSRADRGRSGTVEIGSFQALVKASDQTLAPAGFNLADPKLGGHLVWSDPLQSYNHVITHGVNFSQGFRLKTNHNVESFDWVIAFHHNRAARLASLSWQYRIRGESQHIPERVTVKGSITSPLGPWETLGEFNIAADGSFSHTFEDAPWVRFIHFSFPASPEQRDYITPVDLQIQELPVSESYYSVLGQYGFGEPHGFLEFSSPLNIPEFPEDLSVLPNKTKETALTLRPGQEASGLVAIGEHESWYHLTWDNPEDLVEITIRGIPEVEFFSRVLGADGQSLDLQRSTSDDRVVFTGWPGVKEAWIHLEEPRRSIVFSWDQSGSMGPYIDALYTALFSFIEQINPDVERIRMIAFDSMPRFIDEEWSGDRNNIRSILQNYDRQANSSNSETTLSYVSGRLGRRDGTRAIIHLTDAETYSYDATPGMWKSFEQVRPRIFTVETSSGGSEWTQDLMQDWAMVNRGHYSYMRDVAEVEVAFARASAWLRRPKGYEVSFTAEAVEPPPPPEPGSFQLMAETARGSYLYIIFDASGSMRAPMDGVMKLDIARNAVRQIVDQLPEGSHLALRAYGHSRRAIEEGADEDTELLMPFREVNAGTRAEFESHLARLRPLGRTPLALSLDETLRDIRNVREPVTVILLTDGGEDTQLRRDPVEAAAAYAGRDNVELIIVGFDINRPHWTQQLEAMAAMSGAPYLTAGSAETLSLSMEEAAGVKASRFQILDTTGAVVGEGQSGQIVPLAPGSYEIAIERDGVTYRETITVSSGQTATLSMDRVLNR